MKVLQYLATLSQNDLEDLYKDSWTCQAILRSLPPRAKQYIFKMLMFDSYPLPLAKDWSHSNNIHKEILKKLFELKIIQIKGKQQAEQIINLNKLFQDNIKNSLTGLEKDIFENINNDIDNNNIIKDNNRPPSISELDEFSKTQWEKVLYYLSDDTAKPSEFLSYLLQESNLTKKDDYGQLSITSDGFKFLLKDVYTQIWTLIIVYLDDLEKKRKESNGKSDRTHGTRNDLLGFLFRLSFLQLGKGYSVSRLTALQKIYLLNLRQFGLIHMRSESSLFFYPTRLVISLTTGKTLSLIQSLTADGKSTANNKSSSNTTKVGSITMEKKEEGYIVLETNYRLYAYTSSSLQISLLSLFVKMLYRLPNLAVGIITRESIRTALIHGITADQIIDFIRHNAHPNAVNNGHPIPDVVAEQILIWEQERNRITYTKSVLYNSFPNTECYTKTVEYAKTNGYYIWSNDQLKTLVVTENGSDPIRNHIKKKFS